MKPLIFSALLFMGLHAGAQDSTARKDTVPIFALIGTEEDFNYLLRTLTDPEPKYKDITALRLWMQRSIRQINQTAPAAPPNRGKGKQ